jgi:GNAT superfamily N-acetyltransferase
MAATRPNPDATPVSIAALAPPELAELAAFINHCWREAYAEILDPDFLVGLTTSTRLAILRRKLGAGAEVIVARDTAIIGMAMWGTSQLPGLADAGEIDMLYLAAHRTGTGLGHRLLERAEAGLWRRGFARVGLGVFSDNRRAIRFYAQHGYAAVGHKVDHLADRDYRLDIMAKRLTPPGDSLHRRAAARSTQRSV